MKVTGSRYTLVILTAVTLATVLPLSQAHAQGSLQPPGPPAPTMHSLDQVWYRLDEVNAGISDITNLFYQVDWNALTNIYIDWAVITNVLARIDWDAFHYLGQMLPKITNDLTVTTNTLARLESSVNALASINWTAIGEAFNHIANAATDDHANMHLRLTAMEADMAFTTNMLMQIYDKVNASP